MNYRSIDDLTKMIFNNISKIPHDVDLIVGIPRSGLLVANCISLLMNKPLTDIDGLLDGRILENGHTKNNSGNISNIEECHKILVVDDSVASGESIMTCKSKLSNVSTTIEVVYCAAYVLTSSKHMVDIYFQVVDDPRLFEWNIFHQPATLKKMCFDIDGVLCDDPTPKQNDDGDAYKKFLENASPKIIPSGRIGSIVSSRLEKYRSETELWLKENGIEYDRLILLNATAEERRNNNLHATFKAEYYKKTNAVLFIESEERQAVEINNISGKPVFCIENQKFYSGNKKYKIKFETKSNIRGFFRRSKMLRNIYSRLKGRGEK